MNPACKNKNEFIFSGKCYSLNVKTVRYTEAKNLCKLENKTLITIDYYDELNVARAYATSKDNLKTIAQFRYPTGNLFIDL